MKTATIPPIRVEQEFRTEVESILEQGESLSEFVENSLRAAVAARKTHAEFLKRGIAAIERTERLGNGIPASVVISKLKARVAAARKAKGQ